MVDLIESVLPSTVGDEHVEVFLQLADGLIHETTADNLRPYLDKDFPLDKLEEYIRTFTRPSQIEGYKEYISGILNATPVESSRKVVLFTTALQSKVIAPLLTGSLTLVKDMTLEQREDLLRSWRDSSIPQLRRLFKIMYSLNIAAFVKFASDLHNAAIGFPGRDLRDPLEIGQKVDEFRYTMMDKPRVAGHELYLPNIDVLIIGSGSGAGVVAQGLSEKGFKCLVLEKGKYYRTSEFIFNEKEGSTLYEANGNLITADQQIFILAGSTFGGGSTVNWSACLKTPFKVRKEWYDEHGMEWAATDEYDRCLDYVWKKMGASYDHVEHSHSNSVVLEGGRKLGYAVRPIEQNTGGREHNCGFCHLGCKTATKQGSAACWLRDASDNGCQFMDQVKVLRIIHKGGKASAVLCKDTASGIEFTIRGPKKFVLSGGSLNTPVVLQNSGFKNKHIGKNLKLHPVTAVLGDFGPGVKTEPHYKAIMTSVCTEADDLDGKAHGAKVETLLHSPYMEHVFYPWNGSDSLRQNLLRYNSLSTLLIITRDKTSGKVSADPKRPDSLIVDYSVNSYDLHAILQTLLIGADLLYIEGAKTIFHPHDYKLTFNSEKPKDQRTIKDADYVAWRRQVEKTSLDPAVTPLGSAHQMSSCRISGKGPSDGACDLKGRLYECKNLYVADASAMPTASGANPMISTMTIARYITLGIAKELEPQVKL